MPDSARAHPGAPADSLLEQRAQVGADPDEEGFEDDELDDDDDWDDLDAPEELTFDDDDDWDEDLDEDLEESFEGFIADDGTDGRNW